jgi:SOS response regulatory protein OraA/RecX
MAEVTFELITGVVGEFNKLLSLDPPIEVPEITGRGAAGTAQKKKGVKTLSGELSELIVDPEMVMPTDMKNFTEDAQGLIKELCPDEVERLFPPKKEKAKEEAKKRKSGFVPSEKVAARKKMIEDMISAKKHTRKEIIEAVMEKFPDVTKSNLTTFLTDSKNEKYQKFEKLVVENKKTKIMSFVK